MWPFSLLLDTLDYRVKKHLKNSIHKNKEYLGQRWGFFERNILAFSKHYMAYLFYMLFLLGLITVSTVLWKYNLTPLLPESLFSFSSAIEWQSVYLSSQVTILGVIFPLVIGLIGILLDKKTNTNAIWYLYKRYSGFIFTGLSGILLSIVIVITEIIHISEVSEVRDSICLFLSLWFVLNLVLTGWFLWVTFILVEERLRNKLLIKYAVNEAFIRSIDSSLSEHLPRKIIESFSASSSDFAVGSYYLYDDSTERYVKIFNKPMVIKNIRFNCLKLAIFFLRIANKKNSGVKVRFPLSGKIPSTKFTVVEGVNLSIPWYCKLFLDLSYKFDFPLKSDDSILSDFISSVTGGVEDSLIKGSARHYDDSLDVFQDITTSFINRLSFYSEDRSIGNWLLLPSDSFMMSSYMDDLTREVYKLSEKAVDRIVTSKEYFDLISYVPLGIYAKSSVELPKEISMKLLDSSYRMWGCLVKWSSTIGEDDKVLQKRYEDTIIDFVGRWENWSYCIESRRKKWASEGAAVDVYLHYLALTAQMVITSIRYRSPVAAKWSVDVLNRWFSNISDHSEVNYYYYWNTELLVHSLISLDSSSDEWEIIFKGNKYENVDSAVKSISIMNSWLDVRVVVSCYLLLMNSNNDVSNVEMLVDHLISSEEVFPTGTLTSSVVNIKDGADILSAFIRHRWYSRKQGVDYSSWIEKIIDSFSSIDEPKRVSGRIYSSHGANDARSLIHYYVVLSVRFSESKWSLSNDMLSLIRSGFYELSQCRELINDLNNWLAELDKGVDITDKDSTYIDCLVSNCRGSIKDSIQLVEEYITTTIADAEEDPERLKVLQESASPDIFEVDKRDCPFNLFDNISLGSSFENKYLKKARVNKYQKSNVTNLADNIAVNESGWIKYFIKNTIIKNLYDDFLNGMKDSLIEVELDSDDLIRVRLKEDVDGIRLKGRDPIIFTGSNTFLGSGLIGRYSGFSGLEFKDGFGEGYICHFNDVPVYRLPFTNTPYIVLTAKEKFTKLSFYRYINNKCVDVKYVPDTDLEGSLEFKYFMKAEFNNERSWKYILLDKGE